ncbi:MAG TPA: hypothetical protein VLJ60_00705 [bacterium]|nr:hypothetical protein [bacterium]
MKMYRRIIPFTTLILTDAENFISLIEQSSKWCSSDSFNPQGKVFVIDCDTEKTAVVNCGGVKYSEPSMDFSLYKFIWSIKPSITIDFCNTKESKLLMLFSRSGRTVAANGLYSFFFSSTSYKQSFVNDLEQAAPYLFNSPGSERVGYRTTSIIDKSVECECTQNETYNEKEELIIDLGVIPADPSGKILWIPKRTTPKGMWNDFIALTYFAQKYRCLIDVHFKDEMILRKFSAIFFIKGRKMDFDKYLNIITSRTADEIIFSNESISYKFIIFSFGFTPEYRSLYFRLKKAGENERIATIAKIRKGLI